MKKRPYRFAFTVDEEALSSHSSISGVELFCPNPPNPPFVSPPAEVPEKPNEPRLTKFSKMHQKRPIKLDPQQ